MTVRAAQFESQPLHLRGRMEFFQIGFRGGTKKLLCKYGDDFLGEQNVLPIKHYLPTDTLVDLYLSHDLKLHVRIHCHIRRKLIPSQHEFDINVIKQ